MSLRRHTYMERVELRGSAQTSTPDIPPLPSLHLPSEGGVEEHVSKKPLKDLCLRMGFPEADPEVRNHRQVVY